MYRLPSVNVLVDSVDFRVHIPCSRWHWCSQLLYLLYCCFTYSYLWVWLCVSMCLLTCSSMQYINLPPVVGKREYVEFLKNTFTLVTQDHLELRSPLSPQSADITGCTPHPTSNMVISWVTYITSLYSIQLNNFGKPRCICNFCVPHTQFIILFPFLR